MAKVKAFLSYARGNDKTKRVTQFKEHLESFVEELSGKDFSIFQDDQIEVGELWEKRIFKELDEASVLIAVMTPTFFQRKWCMDEVRLFMDRHETAGTVPAVLPIYWIKTDQVENPDSLGAHPIAARIKSHQYDDWRSLFRNSMGSDEVRKKLIDLAEKVDHALDRSGLLASVSTPTVSISPATLPVSAPTPSKPRKPRKAAVVPPTRRRTTVSSKPAPAPPPPAVVFSKPKVFSPPLTIEDYKAQMISIPAGEFIRGDDSISDAKPQSKIQLSAFSIGIVPVTVGMYKEFCREKKLKMPEAPDFDPKWEQETHPMVNVTWDDAKLYATENGLLLPSEAQWERAARGTDGREYPWEGGWNPELLHWHEHKDKYGGGTAPVGSYPDGKSVEGVLDMAGNVWEWCKDWYQEDWYAKAAKNDPPGPEGGEYRVLRGGSWRNNDPANFRCAYRDWSRPGIRYNIGGFRLVSPGPLS